MYLRGEGEIMANSSRVFLVFLGLITLLASSFIATAQCEVDAGGNVSICAGESVQLGGAPTIVNAGGGAVVTWNNGADDVVNPVVSPASTTTYTVTLSDDDGCVATDQITVTVFSAPVAGFTFNPSGACSSSPVQFTNTSSGAGLEYNWNFGNPQSGAANTATANNPSHTFVAPGNGNQSFTVTLTATDANGCVSTQTQNIPVIQSPSTSLADADIFAPFVMCGNAAQTEFDITINNTSSTQATNTNYSIDWGDGSPVFNGADFNTLSHTYFGTGFFELSYTVTGANGCVNTEVYDVFAGSNPSVGLASPGSTINLCAPTVLNFPITNWESNSDGTLYTVTFSDGSTPETFIHPPPSSISHIFNSSSCGSTSIGGFANSYFVTIIAENPCGFSAATIEPIQTSSAPTADVTVTPGEVGCAGSPFTFLNSSTNANFITGGACVNLMQAEWSIDPPTGWNITGGSLSDPSSFSAVFDPGNYTITMVGSNPCGSDEVSIDICVTTPPVAQFSATPLEGCAPLQVPVNNTSSALSNCDDETYLWQVTPATGWNYASGGASAENPVFNFTQQGTYTLQLTVTNACGSAVQTETVTVYQVPTVSVNPINDGCEGITFTPSAAFTNGGTPITNYQWNFPGGNPASSNQQNPGSVDYPNAGNYTLSVMATNLCGSVTDTESFTIEEAPNVTVTPTNPSLCVGQSVTLNASGAVSYTWTPSTSLNTSVGQTVTATPSSTTSYTVTGTSAAGCTAQASTTVEVTPLPTLTPSSPNVMCADECIGVSVTPSGGTPPYNSFAWSPATGLSQTNAASVTACLGATQTYSVSVTDANGCVASTSLTVTVNPLPFVNAGNDVVLCNQPIAEQLTGFSPAGGSWTGAGVTSQGEFTPSGVGTFELTYSFTDANGCSNDDAIVVEVIDPIEVDAGPDLSFCAGIGGQQLNAPTPGGTWSGDGVTASGVFTPEIAGNYTLTYAVGGGSCLIQDEINVEVFALPEPNAGADVAICEGDAVQLNGSVSGGEEPYFSVAWLSAPGLSNGAVIDPMVNPTSTQTYTLFVTDSNGCEQGDNVIVEVLPAPTVVAGNDLVLCDQPIAESLEGFSPIGGEWTGPGVTPAGVFTPFEPGSFELTYTFMNAAGCGNASTITVTVVDPETANAGDDFAVCLNTDAVNLPAPGGWSGDWVSVDGVFTPQEVGVFTLVLTIGVGTCETSDSIEIEVFPLPEVDAGSDLSVCDGGSLELDPTAQSVNGDIVQWLWSGEGLSSTTIANPSLTPPSSATYSVTVTDAAGCVASDNVDVAVTPLPEVLAGEDLVLCDQPIAEVLTGFAPPVAGAGGTGVWTGIGVVDGAGVFESPGVGDYVLTYTFTDAGGCTDSAQIAVSVVPPVDANAGDDFAICLNNGALQLENFVPENGGSWHGTGIVDAAGVFDPLIAGSGAVTLTFEFGVGTCFTSDELEVTVLDLPVISVTSDPVFCGNDGVSDLGDFSPIGGWWEGEGIVDESLGTFDPALGEGQYAVIYTYTDPLTGCADTNTVVVSVSPVPEAQFTLNPEGCTNAPLELLNTSVGANEFSWDFGNGETATEQLPQYTYAAEGNYTLTLTVTNDFGCQDATSQELEAIHPPEAQFNPSTNEGCAPLEVSFSNTSVGQYLSYEWDLDGTQSTNQTPNPVIYQQEDDDVVYMVTLTVTNYCGSSSADSPITVFPQPIASFGTDYDAFCSPWAMQINNTSVGNPDVFSWDFGNGQTSVLEQPGSTVYITDDEPTDYTVVLNVSNECGADEFSYTVTVLPNTVTAFFNTNLTSGCQPLTVDFTDFSIGGTVISYDFGDGNVSNQANPSHTFTNSGTYEIAQFVNNGCSFDTVYAQVEVFPAPMPAFTSEQTGACVGDPVQFINLTPEVNNVDWSFGDGNTSNVTNPVHTFNASGTYPVTIEVSTDGFECPGTLTQNFTVYPLPETAFDVPNQVGCSPFEVVFTNTTTGGNFYEWDFGNGETSNSVNAVQTFVNDTGAPLLFNVTLTASNLQLCSAETSFDIIVSPTPIADFEMSEQASCSFPVNLQMTNNTLFANGYDWDFGILGSAQQVNPTIVVEAPGSYPITLTASNSFGCSDTHTDTFTIHPLPQVDFSSDVVSGCQPLTVNFTSTPNANASYEWTFSNGLTSTQANPVLTFTQPGLYDATLIVTSENGCVDTLIVDHAVAVYAIPSASFTHNPAESTTIYNPFVDFNNTSSGAVNAYWNFGDGQSSQEFSPSHTYNAPGTYTITLTVESGFSCFAEARSVFVVRDQFNVYVPNAFTPDNDNVNDVFKPVVVGADLLESYEWSIFDRWGIEIFKANDHEAVWLGDFRGGDHYVQDDAYVWMVKYKLKGSDVGEVMTGHVFILR